MIGIYKITNLLNGKIYIGQSVHIERRWQEHCQPSASSLIAKAIKKYGKENFKFEVLVEMTSEEIKDLDEVEQYYIQYYNCTTPNGYNVVVSNETAHTNFNVLNQSQCEQIVNLLINSDLTFEEIASRFQVNRRTINRINNGYTHRFTNLTYPLRNTKKEKQYHYCVDCGAKIDKKATRCVMCAAKMQRVCERPSREELKQLIRTTPFTRIGVQFKVADNTIRKWCEAYGLPKKATEIKQYSDAEWASI